MIAIRYIPPDGNYFDDPTEAFLEDLILNKGKSYWNFDAGSAAIECKTNSARAVLDLIYATEIGFNVIYSIDPPRVARYVAIGGLDYETTVESYVGGEPTYIPLAMFVTREAAWSIVKEFCASGMKTDLVPWRKTSEISWE